LQLLDQKLNSYRYWSC